MYKENNLIRDTWIIYLRKSRQDDPNETVEEVLAKHETMLQEYAERELGRRVEPENIYREVVSGESIDERVEIKKVLARIEDPAVAGVLVIEPSRLSRGDLKDCGRLIDAFRFTHTVVGTPMMVYDLEKKMERKFFQDELLRGNDYLEYTKEILFRGRVAAAKRGCYLGTRPPYGYDKVIKGKDHTLEPNENAEVVRMVFDMYVNEGLTPGRIAQRLNGMGIKPLISEKWPKDTIRWMLRNDHYAGYIRFNFIKDTPVLENGEVVMKRLIQPQEEVIITPGKHEAIIDKETWEKAQQLIARHPRVKHTHELKNRFSGILVCGKCGRVLFNRTYSHARSRYECRTTPRCYMSTFVSDLDDAILHTLEHTELPALEAKANNNDGDSIKIQQRLIKKLEKQMEDYRAQEEKQYDLLETGKYTQDLFDRRNGALRAKIEGCQTALYKAKSILPERVDYEEQVRSLKAAIAALKNPDLTPAEVNRLLRVVIKRIEFYGIPPKAPGEKTGRRTTPNPFTIKIFLK